MYITQLAIIIGLGYNSELSESRRPVTMNSTNLSGVLQYYIGDCHPNSWAAVVAVVVVVEQCAFRKYNYSSLRHQCMLF